jgi:hypothetical protein
MSVNESHGRSVSPSAGVVPRPPSSPRAGEAPWSHTPLGLVNRAGNPTLLVLITSQISPEEPQIAPNQPKRCKKGLETAPFPQESRLWGVGTTPTCCESSHDRATTAATARDCGLRPPQATSPPRLSRGSGPFPPRFPRGFPRGFALVPTPVDTGREATFPSSFETSGEPNPVGTPQIPPERALDGGSTTPPGTGNTPTAAMIRTWGWEHPGHVRNLSAIQRRTEVPPMFQFPESNSSQIPYLTCPFVCVEYVGNIGGNLGGT